jgi:uncharacterized membrane protein
MLEATWQPIGIDDNVVGAAGVRGLEQRVRELEQRVRELDRRVRELGQVAGTRTAEVAAFSAFSAACCAW